VPVPATLAKEAGIKREVVVAGVGDRLEIWDRAAWRTHVKEFEGSAEDVAERLASQRN
jgi:MraZ protein